MAVFSPGPIVHKISGKVGNSLFTKWRGIPIVKQMPTVMTNPQSVPQQTVRNLLGDLGAAWKTLTMEQKNTFTQFGEKAFGPADTLRKVDPLTLLSVPRGPMTDWNAFVQVNMNRILSGAAAPGDYLTEAPLGRSKPHGITNLDLNQVDGHIVVSGELTGTPDADDKIEIWLKSIDAGIHTQMNVVIPAVSPFTVDIHQARGALGAMLNLPTGLYQFQLQVVNQYGLVSVPSNRMAIDFTAPTPPPPPATQLYTGMYNGNGGLNQAITGIGFQPKLVIIYPQNAVLNRGYYMKTDQDGLFTALGDISAFPEHFVYAIDMIISLDADGFTVGASYDINGPVWTAYTYIAMR